MEEAQGNGTRDLQVAILPGLDFEQFGEQPDRRRASMHSGNPFHERFLVETAASQLAGGGERLHLHAAGPASRNTVLPLQQTISTPFGSVWSVWSHVHSLDTTPGEAGHFWQVLDSLFAFLRERRAVALRWATLPTDTEFHSVLTSWLDANGLAHCETKSFRRPVLHADAPNGEASINGHLDGKRLREFRRMRRRLEEQGRLELRVHDGAHDAAVWAGDFLEIERSGWKGAAGTAIACRPHERTWFETVTSRAAEEGRVLVYALELDGRPIAMSVNFRAGSKVWCFKTAYAACLSRFSPGALLEYESTLAALADPSVAWVDACTADDSGLMGTLWPDRRPIADLIISTRPAFNLPVRSVGGGWRGYLAAKRRVAARGTKDNKHRGHRKS